MNAVKLPNVEYWQVQLDGHITVEVWSHGEIDDYQSEPMSRTFLIDTGHRFAYSSGKWLDADDAIKLAKSFMPKNWKGLVSAVCKIRPGYNEILFYD